MRSMRSMGSSYDNQLAKSLSGLLGASAFGFRSMGLLMSSPAKVPTPPRKPRSDVCVVSSQVASKAPVPSRSSSRRFPFPTPEPGPWGRQAGVSD
jgi:hypothetical protein